MEIRQVPRPNWESLPDDGCHGVDGKVLLLDARVSVATLRFETRATIHEHAADFDIDVVCLEGRGFVSVDGRRGSLSAGESVRWPAGAQHRLWTDDTTMVTLMIEHPER